MAPFRVKFGNGVIVHKIFIADSHPIIRDGIAKLVKAEPDLEVCGEAGSIAEASAMVKEINPDIIITGCLFNDGSGIRLIDDLLYYNNNFLILVFSVLKDPVYAERCINAGAKGYVMKNETIAVLRCAIRQVLQGHIYVNGKVISNLLNKYVADKKGFPESPLEVLSNREIEVYQLIGQGLNRNEIAEKMNIGVRTVDTYMESIKKKLKLKDSREVVVHAVKDSILKLI